MITGVVLARNEEINIAGCLQALRPHVDELILIDMESEDQTRARADPLVDRILGHPLVDGFDAARNIAIPEAKHEWMWFVDADERVGPAVGAAVRRLISGQGGTFEAILIPFKNYFCGKWIEHCGWWPGYTMPRVLKRGHFRFSERLHEGVILDGRQVSLPPDPQLAVDHFSYRSLGHFIEKFNEYTTREARHLVEDGASYDWQRAVREMARDLWAYYERGEGSKDGLHGWVLSWLAGQYRWFSHAKLLDVQPQAGERPA